MEENKSKVYVLIDEKDRIIRVEGGYGMSNISDPENWIFLDQGYGDRFHHCQSAYFSGGLSAEDGIPRWKLVDGKPVLRTDEEIEADRRAAPVSGPTLEARVDTLESDSAETREALELILSGVTV